MFQVKTKMSPSSSWSLLFTVVFFLTLCNTLHEVKSGASLSVQRNERHKRSPAIINTAGLDAHEEYQPDYANHRRKRDTTTSATATPNTTTTDLIKVAVNKLQDTKTQLVYFWAGEDVILCLARDVNADASSTLYISNDYGEHFENVSELLVANISNKKVKPILDKFINHPKHNGHFAFSDVKNKLIYTTTDFGASFNYTQVPFTPDEILFDPLSYNNLLAHEESTKEKKLWVSEDYGKTWKNVQSYVKSVVWDESAPSTIYIEREEPNNGVTLLSSKSMFLKNDTSVVMTGIDEFQIKDNYMFLTKKGNNSVKLYISYKRGPFKPAIFPNKLMPAKHYHVADVSEGQMFVCVIHNESLTNLYIGNEPLNSEENPKFSLSLERIVFFKPNLTWSDSWLNDVTDAPFVDLHRVEGMRGVYIASQLSISTSNNGKFDFDQVVSLITFDQGGEWELLKAPDVDDDGDPIYCRLVKAARLDFGWNSTRRNCSLHISQRLSELYPSKRAVPILSKASAVGIVMATGTVDMSMRGHLGVFMSTDGAATWKQILKGNYLYSFGDHGGIIMAVNLYKPGGATNELIYSIDEGETWKTFEFYKEKIKVLGLMTEPGENSTVFTIFGSSSSSANHSWILIKVDFNKVFEKPCGPDDYKEWHPWNDKPGRPCLMGRTDTYQRRIPKANCYNGLSYERLVESKNCSCKRIDFECDFGFREDPTNINKCIRDTSEESEGVKPEWCKPEDLFYTRTRGYRRVPGDTCVGGLEDLYLPKNVSCPLNWTEPEFVIVAKRDAILRIDLNDFNRVETLPLISVGSVVALDFDKTNKSLYWSDVTQDHIKRLRLDGKSEPETLISYGLKSVEGLAFDWISKNLYFADCNPQNSKIEVIRTDVTVWGRMRRKILGADQLDKPRGIAVHPEKGYLFWTDWSAQYPCIGRSGLDGSNPEKIVTNAGRPSPVIHWPNGIVVDTKSDRLYWVDAHLDHLVTSDLDGKQMQFYLPKDPTMSHPFAIAILNDYIYWDDWITKSIYMAKKDSLNSTKIVTVQAKIDRPMDMKVIGSSSQTGSNPCAENSCRYLCLFKPNGTSLCTCPDGLIPSGQGSNTKCVCPDGKPPNQQGECASDCAGDFSFKCADSGFCIPATWKCDGDNDCPDGSDENNCDNVKCNSTSQFQCVLDGRCIPHIWQCDLDEDCPDGSDEKNCEDQHSKCKDPDQFQCANKRCILKKWVCDGDDDCLDGIPSDEIGCKNSTTTCGPDEFKCPGEEERCISEDWKCDGDHDCKDGSDEKDCSNSTCASWKFQCKSGECIMENWRCDGDPDCIDSSDEVGCNMTTTTPPPFIDPFPQGNCTGDQMFECTVSRRCIPQFWKCDSVCDCGEGNDCSDEHGCDGGSVVVSTTPKPACTDKKFRCNSGDCIPRQKVCDGKADCPGKDDEAISTCAHVDAGCKENHVQCGPSIICIAKDKVCDGNRDCPNNWDEEKSTCPGNTWIPSPDQIIMSTKGAWGIAITVIVVIAVLAGTLGVFIVRHRRLRLSFFNFASSHYSTSSGAATFQQSTEELDQPIVRGFSDDEPLL